FSPCTFISRTIACKSFFFMKSDLLRTISSKFCLLECFCCIDFCSTLGRTSWSILIIGLALLYTLLKTEKRFDRKHEYSSSANFHLHRIWYIRIGTTTHRRNRGNHL